jgi:hypothetical protein
MTEEHKKAIKKAKEEREKNKVSFEIDGFIVESYEYGWQIYEINAPVNKLYYTSLHFLLNMIVEHKIKNCGAKSIKDLYKVVTAIETKIDEWGKVLEENTK